MRISIAISGAMLLAATSGSAGAQVPVRAVGHLKAAPVGPFDPTLELTSK